MFTAREVQQQQFLAWAEDVPYLVTFTPLGAGLFHAFRFVRADTDFRGTLADEPRLLWAAPEDVAAVASPAEYVELVLDQAARRRPPV